MYGDLPRFGGKHLSFDARNVTHIILFKFRIGFLADTVPGHIALNIAGQILDIAKRGLAHDALGHDTSCDAHGLPLQFPVLLLDLRAVMSHIVFSNLKGILARLLQNGQLLPSHLQQLADILLLFLLCLIVLFFRHFFISYYNSPFPVPAPYSSAQ